MKETDAMQKWCPFGRQIIAAKDPKVIGGTQFLSIPAHNRVVVGPQQNMTTPCIGSNCAVWRPDDNMEGYGGCGLVR